MELKSIIAIGLVVFIVAGLVFLYVRNRKKRKQFPCGRLKSRPLYISLKICKGDGFSMKKERFEARLFRIFAQAGYSPVQLLTVTPEEMVEIPGITVPNIRAVLCVQNRVLAEQNTLRAGRLVEELLQKAEESRRDNG